MNSFRASTKKIRWSVSVTVEMEKIGEWAFLIFVIVAIVAGIAIGASVIVSPNTEWVYLTMIILGIIVGFITITEKEATQFLIAAIALMAVSIRGSTFQNIDTIISPLGSILDAIVINITAFVAPAAVILAIRAIYAMASRK